MINFQNKSDCCGCTSCETVCPRQCIKMNIDEEGFYYPKIDLNLCINCGKCEKVCPVINYKPLDSIVKSYVGRVKDNNVLIRSTSGGIFTPLMNYFLSQNGCVYGAIFDKEECLVHHIRITNEDDNKLREKLPGSKYVSSNIIGIFKKIRKDLENNKMVLYCGTPCQVAGLRMVFGENPNLFLIDFVCRGNPSPLVLNRYFNEIENKYNSKIQDVVFRFKLYGYHHHVMKITLYNKKVLYSSIPVNPYLKSFFENLSSRPSCYQCHFKGINHPSDITLFDSWNASKVADIIEDDLGYSNILIQNNKGEKLFEIIKDELIYKSSDLKKCIDLDGIMINNCVPLNKKRGEFFKNINDEDFSKYCRRFFKISFIDKTKEILKKIVYRKIGELEDGRN